MSVSSGGMSNNMDIKVSDEVIGQIHVREFDDNKIEVVKPCCYPVIQSSIRSSKSGKLYAKIHCPLCNEDVGSKLEYLWLHFYESHQDKYEFTAVRENEQMTHFGAKEKRHHDVRYTDSMTSMKQSLDFVLRNTKMFIPKRQYYHFSTLDKIQQYEYIMELDCDKDQFMDMNWQHEFSEANLGDFTDVHDVEFKFCCIWNAFLRENPVLKRIELPSRMLEFALHFSSIEPLEKQPDSSETTTTSPSSSCNDNNSTSISTPNYTSLIEPFTLFLLSRWDEGELNRTHLEYILDLFHNLIETRDE